MNKIYKKIFYILLCILLNFTLSSCKNQETFTLIKPCNKEKTIQFLTLLASSKNEDIREKLAFPTDISQYEFDGSINFDASFSPPDDEGNYRDYYQFYWIKSDNIYLLTHMYIASGYSGSSEVVSIFHYNKTTSTLENASDYDNIIALTDPNSGPYDRIKELSHCGNNICLHFAYEPFVRWCNTPDSQNPFISIDDWVVLKPKQTEIVNRHMEKLSCADHEKDKLKIEYLREQLEKQIEQNQINLDWLGDGATDENVNTLLKLLKKSLEQQTILSLTLKNISLNREEVNKLASLMEDVKTLENITLNFNGINSKGVDSIINIIQNNQQLKSLNLSGNTFDSKSAFKLAKAIQDSKNLSTLKMSYSLYQADSIQSIVNAIQKNKAIQYVTLKNLGVLDKRSKENLIKLLEVNHLKALDLSGTDNLGDEKALILLQKNNNLTTLKIDCAYKLEKFDSAKGKYQCAIDQLMAERRHAK